MKWFIIFWLGVCPVCSTKYTERQERWIGEVSYETSILVRCGKCQNAFWAFPDSIVTVTPLFFIGDDSLHSLMIKNDTTVVQYRDSINSSQETMRGRK